MNSFLKNILLIIFVFLTFISRSQIISDSVRPYNCYHEGGIFLEILNLPQTIKWSYSDDTFGWIDVDTMLSIQLSSNLDSLFTTKCGSYKVVVGSVTNYYWISCNLGITASHKNVNCFGDSTGILKRVAH